MKNKNNKLILVAIVVIIAIAVMIIFFGGNKLTNNATEYTTTNNAPEYLTANISNSLSSGTAILTGHTMRDLRGYCRGECADADQRARCRRLCKRMNWEMIL